MSFTRCIPHNHTEPCHPCVTHVGGMGRLHWNPMHGIERVERGDWDGGTRQLLVRHFAEVVLGTPDPSPYLRRLIEAPHFRPPA